MKTLSILKPILSILTVSLLPFSSNAELINGAGSSFAFPIYSKWSSEYQKTKTDVKINYQSVGSGAGVQQIINQTVDFAGSDAPMQDAELASAKTKIIHIPTAMGAVVLAYNLPAYKAELKLTPELIAKIFSGKITRWDDSELLKLNPNLAQAVAASPGILSVYRSDGSGTTSIFTEYLSVVDKEWKEKIGQGKTVNWPVGLAAKGNEGVTGNIRQNEGAIGYVEMTFALSNGLKMAIVKNQKGFFVNPSVEAVTASAENVKIPNDMRMSIINSANKKAYPISSFTYMLVPQVLTGQKGKDLLDFISWSVTTGQGFTTQLHYASLPKKVVTQIQTTIQQIKVQ